MLSRRAASVRLPPQASNALRIIVSSSRATALGRSAFKKSRCDDACVCVPVVSMSRASMTPLVVSTQARSITFRSSRTLPDQSCRHNFSTAAGLSTLLRTPDGR